MSDNDRETAASPHLEPIADDQHPPFEPIFTLLTNTTTNTTIHPHVRYIFTDDDPSIIHHCPDPSIIVDLEPTAESTWGVSWASSLSPAFAVTGSSLSVQQGEHDDASMMLRIEGVEREPVDMKPDSLRSSTSTGQVDRGDVEGLMDDFRRRMAVLKGVVGEGERRREVLRKMEGVQDQGDVLPEKSVEQITEDTSTSRGPVE